MNTLTKLAALASLASPTLAQDPCGAWSVVPAPMPAGSTHTVLEDVVSIAPDDAWAVGRKMLPAGAGSEAQTVAMHWDGASWSIVPAPSPSPYPGGGWSELLAVEALSSTDVWAAGDQRIQAPDQFVGTHLMVQHWNGSQWSLVPAPVTIGGSGNFVDDIEAIAADDIWFVGDWLEFPPTSAAQKRALAMRWNGSGFQVFPTPFFDNAPIGGHGLTAVSAVSSDDVWAVGGGHDGDYVGFSYIVHWNGSQWEYRPGPTAGSAHRLYDVEAVASNDVWAVGDYFDANGYHGMMLHFDGASWTRLPDPPVGGASIEVVAPDKVYVGGAGVALWDGSTWTVVASFPGVDSPSVLALEPIGPCSLWGVGRRFEGETRPLTVRLDGAPAATTYCDAVPSSIGVPASIGFAGSASVGASDLVLTVDSAPANKTGLFFYGTQRASLPFGNGVRCIGGTLVRLPLQQTDANGSASRAFSAAAAGIGAGEARDFQFWYRDPPAGGANFNASNGLEVVFQP